MIVDTVCIGLSVSFCQLAGASEGVPTAAPGLSVEETLGAVLLRSRSGAPWNVFRASNAGAKPALRILLADKDAASFHIYAWRIMGYIGDAADAGGIENAILNDFTGVLTPAESDSITAMLDCLGLMCRRDIQEAADIMDRMCGVDYWKKAKFRWFDEERRLQPGFVYRSVFSALFAYRLSEKADLREKVASVMDSIEDPNIRRYAKGFTSDYLQQAAKEVALAERKPLPKRHRKLFAEKYRENKSLFAEKSELDEQETVFIRDVSKEAHDEFEKTKSAVIKGDYDALLNHLLDDGRIIDEKRLKRSWPEYEKDLAREQQLFKLLDDSEPSPRDYKVGEVSSYEFPSLDEEGAPVGATKVEPVSVSWRLEGSGEVGNVFFRRQKGSLTVARDGSLIVVMKKIDGRWYWNPFGW